MSVSILQMARYNVTDRKMTVSPSVSSGLWAFATEWIRGLSTLAWNVTVYCFRKIIVGCFKQMMFLSSFCSHSVSVQSQTVATSGFSSYRWTWIPYFMVFVYFSHPEHLVMRVWMGTLFMPFCKVLGLTFSWGEKRHCFLYLKLFKEWAEIPLNLGCVVTWACFWVWHSIDSN